MPNHRNTAEGFWARLDRSAGADGCWAWQGHADRDGYGEVAVYGVGHLRAHRAAWFYTHGTDPVGSYVLHRCDNPKCCNPAHLFLGTAADNHADSVGKGRHSHGVKHGMAKLDEARVRAIRAAADDGQTYVAIARLHGVSPQTAACVAKRSTWAHVA